MSKLSSDAKGSDSANWRIKSPDNKKGNWRTKSPDNKRGNLRTKSPDNKGAKSPNKSPIGRSKSPERINKYYKTKRGDREVIIKEFREKTHLNEPPFDQIDDDLIFLILVNQCNFSPKSRSPSRYTRTPNLGETQKNNLYSKFGTCDSQTLEFYGDKMLGLCVSSLLMRSVFLTKTPNFLTQAMSDAVKNRTLIDIIDYMDVCVYTRKGNFKVEDYDGTFKHNACSDMFESIVGAIYYHFYIVNPGFYDPCDICDLWISQYTPIPSIIKEFIDKDMPEFQNNILVTNDIEKIWKKFISNDHYENIDFKFEQIPKYSILVDNNNDKLEIIEIAKNFFDIMITETSNDGFYVVKVNVKNVEFILESEYIGIIHNDILQFLLDLGFIKYSENIPRLFSAERD